MGYNTQRMGYNTRRICKPLTCGSWFTNSSRVLQTSRVVYQLLVNSQLCFITFLAFDWLKNSDCEPIV